MRRDTPRYNQLLQHHHVEGGEISQQYFDSRSGYHWLATILLRESVQEIDFSNGTKLFKAPR